MHICIYIYIYYNNNNNNNNRQNNNNSNNICSKPCYTYVFSSMQVSEYLYICPLITVR